MSLSRRTSRLAKYYVSGTVLLTLLLLGLCLHCLGMPKTYGELGALAGILIAFIASMTLVVVGYNRLESQSHTKKILEFQLQKMFYDMNRDWLEDEHRKTSDETWVGLLPPRMRNPFGAFNGMIKARDRLIDLSEELNRDLGLSIEKNPKFYPKSRDNASTNDSSSTQK